MLWLKSFHVVFVVTWLAGLFYPPGLFVYHAMTENEKLRGTFKLMQRRLMVMTRLSGTLILISVVILVVVKPV